MSGWTGRGKPKHEDYFRQKRKRGRPKGTGGKQSKKVDGGVIAPGGFFISEEELKEFKSLVRRSNYKREKQIKEEASLPRRVGGRETGDTIQSLMLMGAERDFIITEKSTSLQRFKTRESFDAYKRGMEKVLDPEFETNMAKLYKRNYMKALENEFGDMAKDIKMKVRMMKPKDFMKYARSDEFATISYIYDPSARDGRANQIRASLGMKLKEEFYEDY